MANAVTRVDVFMGLSLVAIRQSPNSRLAGSKRWNDRRSFKVYCSSKECC